MNEATGRPKSVPTKFHTHPRIRMNAIVTLEDLHKKGTVLTARVQRYNPETERYVVSARGSAIGSIRSDLRAAQLHVHGPTECGDHIEIVEPKPPLRSAMTNRDYYQWRDEMPHGRAASRW